MTIRIQILFTLLVCIASAQTKTGTPTKAADENLFTAIKVGKLDGIKGSLSKGANINARRGDGLTPLMYAALWGKKEVVELLIAQKGIDLNALQGDCNATCYAFVVEKYDIVSLLESKGAKIPLQGLSFGMWQAFSLMGLPPDEFEAVAPSGIKEARKKMAASDGKGK